MHSKRLLVALALVVAPAAHAQERLFIQVPALVEPGAQMAAALQQRCGVASVVGGQVFRNVQQRYGNQTRLAEQDTGGALLLRITILGAEGGRGSEGLSVRADLLRNGAPVASNTFGQTLGRGRGCVPIDSAAAGVGRQVAYWVPNAIAGGSPPAPSTGAPATPAAPKPSSPPSSAQAAASPPPSPAPSSNDPGRDERLRQLKELLDTGKVTQAEYDRYRAAILKD